MQRIKYALNWSGIFPFLSSGQTLRWAVAAVKGTVEICALHVARMQDIQAKSSIQQDDLFRQKTGLEFQEEMDELLHLEYSFLWDWNMEAWESIS